MINLVIFFLTAIAIPFGSEAVGYYLLKLLRLPYAFRTFFLNVSVGLTVLTWLIIAAGTVTFYLSYVFWAIWAIWLTSSTIRFWVDPPDWFQSSQKWLADRNIYIVLLRVILLVLFVITFAGTMTPETRHDPYDYHLNVPSIYLSYEKIVEIPWHVFSYMPKNGEMLFVLGLAIGNDSFTKLLHFIFGWLCVLLIAQWVNEWSQREQGLFAGILIAALPVFGFVVNSSYIDLMRAYWELVALWTLYQSWAISNKNYQRWILFFSCLFAGMALGTKYVAWLVFGVPYCVLLLITLWRFRQHNTLLIMPVLFLAGLIPVLPWLLYNWHWTQNPVYPLLPQIFGFNTPAAHEAYQFFRSHAPSSDLLLSLNELPAFIAMRLGKLMLDGNALLMIGIITLALFPWWSKAYSGKTYPKKMHRGLLLFVIFSGILFLIGTDNHDGRFCLSTIMILALPATTACYTMRDWVEANRKGSIYLLPILILLIFLNAINYRFSQLHDLSETNIPMFNESRRTEWLTQRFVAYPAVHWANQNLPEDAFVLGMGYPLMRRHCARIKYGYIPGVTTLEPPITAPELSNALYELGVTHITKPYEELNEHIDLSILEDRYLLPIFEHRHLTIYRFHPSGIPQ